MIHLVIVWANALSYRDNIIEEISSQFNIRKIFNIHWDKKLYFKNLKIFYSHSLKDMSDNEYNKIISSKIRDIGIGDFVAIVFEDEDPNIKKRDTTSGVVEVNTHVFDIKSKYRNIIGGSRIHSSNDNWETNKDLTVLFGLNTEDFLKKYSTPDTSIENISKNCEGFDGYENISRLFYVLNNCIKYVVLRNHENLPDKYVSDLHGDIDLLVEHNNYAVKLTNAKRVFKQKYRVYHTIKVAGLLFPFDFRYVGDQYYDTDWEKKIIEDRILVKDVFYAPCNSDQFYSLLYHAYVQKYEIKEDYFPKLEHYASCIEQKYSADEYSESLGLLYPFLKTNSYEFVCPTDKTVIYNKKNVLICRAFDFLKNNIDVTDLKPIHIDHPYLSGYVYFEGLLNTQRVFIKYGGSGDSCKREFEFTKRAYSMNTFHFVEPLFLGKNDDTYYAVYKFVNGKSVESLPIDSDDQKNNLASQLIEIYEILQSAHILHRDIRPENLMIADGNIVLIDFQYAVDNNLRTEYSDLINNTYQIMSLGDHFRYKWYAWSDYYSFSKTANYLNVSFNAKEIDKPFFISPKVFFTLNFWIWFAKKIRTRLSKN